MIEAQTGGSSDGGTSWQTPTTLSPVVVAAALGLPTPTPEQQRVIEAPPTPALVVAGAGSGKTETMAGRVVWLVANGHVRRDEILGLTFTRKAAGELAERIMSRLHRIDEFRRRGLLPHLERIIGEGLIDGVDPRALGPRLDEIARRFDVVPPAATDGSHDLLRPHVATYNAFADGIVREHAARIGRDAEVSLLSQSGSWLLARSVVLRSDDDRLAERDSVLGSTIDAVQRLASEALDNRADLDEVATFGERFAAGLEPFTDPSLQNPRILENAWAAMEGLPVIAGLAKEYAAAKDARGVLDFADQVSGALDILAADERVGHGLREQYRVVLLDEYQDTSVLQTRLLATIFRDHPVMAVGDPYQSIYGWRGASADNLDTFAPAFADALPCARFDLMTSWRNDVDVLTAANALLEPLRGQGRISVGALRPRPGAAPGDVLVTWSETIDDEAEGVAEWFTEVRAARTAATGEPGSGAILFRAKKHMQMFADALERRGIPHRILGLGGLLSTPEVTDVIAALRVIHDPAAGSALIRLLTGPRFGIGVADLSALQRLAATLSKRDSHGDRLGEELLARLRASAGSDEQLSIVDALDVLRTIRTDSPLLAGFSDAARARLREAADVFDRLRRAAGQPIPELVRLIETELRLDIELAANETRGPARLAATHLRAFLDEVRSFLAADERGTIGSLLSWLAHAENTDELMPRPEPPQSGVVQLLTVHGSKGLEWDAVAVVRLVADELPKRPQSTRGWLRLGVLPYRFRGDREALPVLRLPEDEDIGAADIIKAMNAFSADEKAMQEAEERRLAYVAVTRARSALLLTGSSWGGQQKPRQPSPYLQSMLTALGRDELAPQVAEENPFQADGRVLHWPLDALGARRAVVQEAAGLVRGTTPAPPTPELERLLAEREARARRVRPTAPARIPASMFKDYVRGFDATAASLARPMPERPFPQTRLGTDFHAWVEHRSEMAGMPLSPDDGFWEQAQEEDEPLPEAEAAHDAELQRMREAFLQSEWADLRPLEIESEVNYVLHAGEDEHIVICRLDAVYERDGRIEIVDWKTGRPPATAAERNERLLQLAHYRVAYHHARGVPLDRIDVAWFYVAHDLVLRPDRVYSEVELAELWTAARDADSQQTSSDD